MIQQLHFYEGINKPEPVKNIHINSNPKDIVRSTYQIWLPFTRKVLRKSFSFETAQDIIYDEVVSLLKPHSAEFLNVKYSDLEDVISDVSNVRNIYLSGTYLSALLNATSLPVLDGIFNTYNLGFRLAPDKKLILREGSNVCKAGIYAKGTIINYGDIMYMAKNTQGGIQVNFGSAYELAQDSAGGVQLNLGEVGAHMASGSSAGLQINIGKIKWEDLGRVASGGIQLNYGAIKEQIAPNPYGGFQINLGNAKSMAEFATGGIQLNFGKLIENMAMVAPDGIYSKNGIKFDLGNSNQDFIREYDEKTMQKIKPLLMILEAKLIEIKFMKSHKNNSDEDMELIFGYDWKSFEGDILNFGNDLKRMLK